MCVPVLVTTFPEWLSGTEPLPHKPGAVSVLVVFVVFCVHMHSFVGLMRGTPPSTFSDTAITDRHSVTTIFQLRAHWVRISWFIGSQKSFRHVLLVYWIGKNRSDMSSRWESNPRLPACKASAQSTLSC